VAGHATRFGATIPEPVQISVLSTLGSARNFVIPVHPVRFSDVHVAGRLGSDVRVVFPVRLTDVILVPNSAKVVSRVGNVGNVVRVIHSVRSRPVVCSGNDKIDVIRSALIFRETGSLLHPASRNVLINGRAGNDVNAAHPVRFSVSHVIGRFGTDPRTLQPVQSRDVTFVVAIIIDVIVTGNLGSAVSDVQPERFKLVISEGNPPIVVSPAPAITNEFGSPVHPVRFSDVHVAGRLGTDVSVVFPERLTDVTLVPTSANVVRPVGNAGIVVSDVHPERFKLVISEGNPLIVVSPAPAITNAFGSPVHPVRFSDVNVAGRLGTDVSFAHPVRFSDLQLGGIAVTDSNSAHPVKLRLVMPTIDPIFTDDNVEGNPGTEVKSFEKERFRYLSPVGNWVIDVIFGGVFKFIIFEGIPASVVSLVEFAKSSCITDEGNPASDVIFGGGVRTVTVEGTPLSVVSLVEAVKFRTVTDGGITASVVIFGGVLRAVTVEGIPLSVVSLSELFKYRVVTDEGIPASDVIFTGGVRTVTVEGTPLSVVSLVEDDKPRFVTVPGIPAYDVIFGGVIRPVTVEGMFASVTIAGHLYRAKNVIDAGKFVNDFSPGAFISI
jgi:hypothetical protein